MAAAELSKLVSAAVQAAAAAEDGDTAEMGRAQDALRLLQKKAVTAELLKETESGKKINKIAKSSNSQLAAAAAAVVQAWKDCVKAQQQQPASQSSQLSSQPSATSPAQLAPAAAAAAAATTTGPGPSKQPPPPTAAAMRRQGSGASDGSGGRLPAAAAAAAAAAAPPPPPSAAPSAAPAAAAARAAPPPPKTGNPKRDRIRTLLQEGLLLVPEGDACGDAGSAAAAVEAAVHAQFPDMGPDYASKIRTLSFNLKDANNPDLRRAVLAGTVSPEQLVGMAPEELASQQRREKNKEIREQAAWEVTRDNKQVASTDQFQCGKCKKRQCTYYQMQTRSADEPMTTFVTCVACGNKWKFC